MLDTGPETADEAYDLLALWANPRVLFYLEHAIQDAGLTREGQCRVISKQISPRPKRPSKTA